MRGHPRLSYRAALKTWMPGTRPGMTNSDTAPDKIRFYLLRVSFAHLGLDLRHARYPAIVILGLPAHVAEHLRVRQDDECFLLEAGEHILRHLLRRQIAVAGLRTLRDRTQHVGVDALRTQDRNLDAIGLVRDRKVLREPDCRMLGRRINGASDLRKEPGCGNRVEEIPLPARLHARDQMPRGVDMGHDMNSPASRPRLVGSAAGVFRQRIETASAAGI